MTQGSNSRPSGDTQPRTHALQDHYDTKYAAPPARPIQPARYTARPRNRYEAVTYLAGCGTRALDIGAGSGEVMLAVRRRFDSLVGLELSSPRAEQLRSLFQNDPAVDIIHDEFPTLSSRLADAEFDVVIMCAVIEHLIDPIAALREVRRILAPNGRAIIDTPNIAKWTRRVKLGLGRFPSTASIDEGLLMYDRRTPTTQYDEGHLHYFTLRSLTRVCIERAGFRRVVPFGYGKHFWLSHAVPTLFSEACVIAYA